ncbi:ATP-binding protein [Streptomyces sp. WMMC940]|uniref:ATP-binding protein n=1 Tax=Streptomyces sp. WMMC940 TaxID=3015153 RepID=UPI003FCECFFE
MTTSLHPIDTEKRCRNFQLPTADRAPCHARQLVRHTLAEWLIPHDVLETAQLLVSELVTNAVTHAEGPVGLLLLRIRCAGRLVLRVEVTDTSTRLARRSNPTEQDEHGRGLELVQTLADRWGQDPLTHGKRIWCELLRHEEAVQARWDPDRGEDRRLAS